MEYYKLANIKMVLWTAKETWAEIGKWKPQKSS